MPVRLTTSGERVPTSIDMAPLIRAIVADLTRNVPIPGDRRTVPPLDQQPARADLCRGAPAFGRARCRVERRRVPEPAAP